MKKIALLCLYIFFLGCQEKEAVYVETKKGDVYLDFIATLETVVSYNANPDADRNFQSIADFDYKKDPLLRELTKQPYFEGDLLNVKKLKPNVEPNKKYFLDKDKKISFEVVLKNYASEAKLKLQSGNQLYTYLRPMLQVEGVSILDLDKDGIKEVIIIQYGYFMNTEHYYFEVYSPLKK